MSELAIEAHGLTRRFGDLVAVDHVDLAIPRAQIYGFLGPNGSGKTTTIRMLCGLLRPSAGDARVLDCRLPRDANKLRRKIGYMTQRFSLYEELTVRENLDFMGEIYSLPPARRRQRVDALLAEFRLDRPDQRAGTLSGGQRQRLALAASLIHEPELLFLDEPTSAVDPQSRREFWDSLFELADEGTTLLVSTHYMDEAERCTRLAILDHGRIVADGAPADLMSSLPGRTLLIESRELPRARQVLKNLPNVIAFAQIGASMRVLVAEQDGIERDLDAALQKSGIEATVRATAPNLEDVFVAATQTSRSARGEAA